MQQTKSVFTQNVRRIGMIIGFTVFAFFIYRASHEVSNPKVATGVPRTQAASSHEKATSTFDASVPVYKVPAIAVVTASKPNDTQAESATISDSIQDKRPDKNAKVDNSKKAVKHIPNLSVGSTQD